MRARAGRDQASTLHRLLRDAGLTVSTAESLTGGRLAARLTETPGASATYRGGVVAYATELKQTLLGVPDEVVERYGVVSAECARAMAAGVRERTGASYGLATTGVAGPDEQESRPVGTVFIGVAGPGLLETVALELSGDRASITDRTCDEALSALAGILRREEAGLG